MAVSSPGSLSALRGCARGLAAAAVLSAGLGGEALAAPTEPLSLSFELFAKGVRVYAIDFDADLGPSGYKADIKARTVGIASWFIDESYTLRASGRFAAEQARPAHYYDRKDEDGESKTAEVNWAGGKVSAKRSYKLDSDRAAAVQKVLTPAIPDPVSAILTRAIDMADQPCKGAQRIYDGKQIYEFVFSFVKRDDFGEQDAGVYRGPSYQCKVEYKPVAGQSERKLKRLAKKRQIYRVWFAPVASKALGRDILLPIAATGEVKGHEVVIYTRAATIAGRPLNQKSLASR